MIKLKGTDRFFPPGFEYIPELRRALAAYSAAFIAAAIGYLWRFDTAFDALYIFEDRVKKLIPDAVMDDFCDLALPGMNLFPAVSLVMVFFAATHYFYHYQETKSIYTMKRLPKKPLELHKRCLTAPLAGMAATVLLFFLTLAVLYVHYILIVPEQCIAPGQLERLFLAIKEVLTYA